MRRLKLFIFFSLIKIITLNAEQIQSLYETGKMPEPAVEEDHIIETEPVQSVIDSDDDLLDEMK